MTDRIDSSSTSSSFQDISVRRPTTLLVDLAAIVHNFQQAEKQVGGNVQTWPVIKANGYSLGAVPIARTLEKSGAVGFNVALLDEALALREAGIHLPIVLLSGFPKGAEQIVVRAGFQPLIFSLKQAQRLHHAALLENRKVTVHLKIDTGMRRLGFEMKRVYEVLNQLCKLSGIVIRSYVSHLACADLRKSPVTTLQAERMHHLSSIGPMQKSLANSAGILGHPETHFDWVRPGIMLYGVSPFFPETTAEQEGLRPVVAWKSRLIQIQTVPAGSAIGYGHTFTTLRNSRIAQIPVGYGDGYSRSLSNRGEVLIRGSRAPVVGRVCMDLIAVDITDLPEVREGDPVTLIGRDGTENIAVEEMALWQETIPYETLSRISMRVPRVYLK